MPVKTLRITTPVALSKRSTHSPRPTSKRQPMDIAKRKQALGPPPPLEIYELLEQILLHLPMRSLLLSQRVCRRWRQVITTSKAIQRALHFLPVSPDEHPHKPPQMNPLLAYEPPFCNYFDILTFGEGCDIMGIIDVRNCHSGWEREWPRAMLYREASWRRMQLATPVFRTVGVVDHRIAPVYDDVLVDMVEDMDGVKLGDVLLLEEVVVD